MACRARAEGGKGGKGRKRIKEKLAMKEISVALPDCNEISSVRDSVPG
jgi:hypothetical protein